MASDMLLLRGLLDRRRLLLGGAAVGLAARAGFAQVAAPDAIPPAPRDGSADTLHGVTVPDPFRPFEDPSRADVKAWIEAMDAQAKAALNGDPLHGKVMAFLSASGKYQRPFPSRRVGAREFNFAFDGSTEQPRLEVTDGPAAPSRVLLDPGKFAEDGTTALWGYFPDRFANKIAYLMTEAGGDATTLHIRDVRTGVDLNDKIDGCRFSSVVWLPDGQSFYYTRPPGASENAEWDRASHCIFHHQLGYPQSADRMIWRFPNRRNVHISLRSSYTTNQLFITAGIGTDRKNGMWIAPIDNAALAIRVVPMGRHSFFMIRNVQAQIYATTDLDAPKGRIVRMSLGGPNPEAWKTIVPEGDGVIDNAIISGGRLLVRRFKDLGHTVAIYDLEGSKLHDITFGERVSVAFQSGERDVTTVNASVSSRQQPGRVEKINLLTGKTELVSPSKAKHDLSDITVRTVFATSKDGTKIPVTLMHRPDMVADGENRTLLYGYGSYGITQQATYSPTAAAWVRLGGVYAVAHIRGGGENGNAWHEAARLGRKQTSYDDFAAAAEWLAAEKITRASRLGIHGGSSGGRLVLGCMVQRPTLYGAVVASVPVADMLRFDKHTWGVSWKVEYGDVDKAEEFKWLHAHSPLHNIKAGVAYPPLLLLTADNDQRVVPAHTYKFAAALKEASPKTDVLVRTRRKAGHGQHNAYTRAQENSADVVTFMTGKLGGPVLDLPKIDA
jgi:prolyl oligopeptidase